MAFEESVQEDNSARITTERGIYTLTSAELQTISDIELSRREYSFALAELSPEERIQKLKSILNDMKIFMESYNFNSYIVKTKVAGYNFYYVENSLDYVDGEDIDVIRNASHIAFTVWKSVLKILGAALPTYHSSTKKKILDSLFAQVLDDIDEDKFIQNYRNLELSTIGIKRKGNFEFFNYCLSQLKYFDLNADIIWVGKARSSKSTGAYTSAEEIYTFRGEEFQPQQWVKERCIYSFEDGIEALKSSKADVNLFDEEHRTHDRRKSMRKEQVELTGMENFLASKNSVNHHLIQNFTDIDMRSVSKSGIVVLVIGRGHGLLFSDSRFLAVSKDFMGFEQFMSNPALSRFPPLALHLLKRQSSYVCEMHWNKRLAFEEFGKVYNRDRDPGFAAYLDKKLIEQQSALVEKKKSDNRHVEQNPNSIANKVRQLWDNGNKAYHKIAKEAGTSYGYVATLLSSYRRQQADNI